MIKLSSARPIQIAGEQLTLESKTDRELVEAFQQGNVEGFDDLVRRYQQKVYWVARRIVGTHRDADDVVQDVFIKVYGALPKFRGDSEFFTWLYRIAVNASLNAQRLKRMREFLPFDDLVDHMHDDGAETDAPLLRQEYESAVERAIASLPLKQRTVFVMRYHDERPYEEIARLLKRSVGGVKANYSIALRKIREIVRKELNS